MQDRVIGFKERFKKTVNIIKSKTERTNINEFQIVEDNKVAKAIFYTKKELFYEYTKSK